MKINRCIAIGLSIAFAAGLSSLAYARAKAVERYQATVDNQGFKIIRYDNGSAKVLQSGMFGDGISFNLRDRMRRAAKQATGCDMADDFWLDGKLVGTLVCDAAAPGASS
ncbi:hypothetical protein U5A82_13950 [Sphingobium sp. CR2-8]|uniref:hypothetical protein n=1 Tax=Sphingobium sp. CR2-8 TaxID=1306534 RepID=UPI002DBC24B8|nr:hypothetical protein [Sphingobium sp. CR2-8]MEC3911525.1 hypothetical protein [Sphingobium sp. CR2-8]